jgi:hypothetical protein
LNNVAASGIGALSSYGTGYLTSQLPDTELGRSLGTLFSSGINSATSTMSNNLLKG